VFSRSLYSRFIKARYERSERPKYAWSVAQLLWMCFSQVFHSGIWLMKEQITRKIKKISPINSQYNNKSRGVNA